MNRLLSITLALALFPATAASQALSELCDELRSIRVGQWAEYSMTAPASPEGQGRMRLAIVGTEQADGERHYWHEAKAETPMGTMITQMLVPGFPYNPSGIKRMIVKMGDQPAQDVTGTMLEMMRSQTANMPTLQAADRCGDTDEVEEIGWETVSVPAGSFHALHLRSTEFGADWWISQDASFGMVKFVGAEGLELLLLGHGTGATSSLDK